MNLLFDESPIAVQRGLCRLLGSADDAAIVQQIHYWTEFNKKAGRTETHFIDGRWWVYNTVEKWLDDLCWFTTRQLGRRLKRLRDTGIVIAKSHESAEWNQTLWYSIDYEKISEMIEKGQDLRHYTKTVKSNIPKVAHSNIPKVVTCNYTESTTESTSKRLADASDLNSQNRYESVHKRESHSPLLKGDKDLVVTVLEHYFPKEVNRHSMTNSDIHNLSKLIEMVNLATFKDDFKIFHDKFLPDVVTWYESGQQFSIPRVRGIIDKWGFMEWLKTNHGEVSTKANKRELDINPYTGLPRGKEKDFLKGKRKV